MDSAFLWIDHDTAIKPYQNQLSRAWYWFNRLTALSTFSNSLSVLIFRFIFPSKWSANLCMRREGDIVHWLAETHNISSIQWWESYFKYERSNWRAYLKRERERERESRCRLLVMSSRPDDGALVMRWKKANEALRTKFSLMILHPERSKKWCFLKLLFSDSLSI